MNKCHYCADLKRYDLLPAIQITRKDQSFMSKGFGEQITKMVHPDAHPVTGRFGVECKNEYEQTI